MKPKISVLMCVYNEDEYFVSQAIHSITNQTFEDFEFIIINDNPNNQSMINLIKKESQLDSRIKLIFNEENKGLQQNLIDGIDFCSADYIARMDADDISFLHRFEIQYKLITEYNYDIVGLNYQTIDLEGNILNEEVEGSSYGIVNKYLLQKNIIPNSSLLIRKSTLINVGGFRKVLYAEDYDFLLRVISAGGTIFRTEEVLLQVRENPNGISLLNQEEQIISSIYVRQLFLERMRKKQAYDSHTLGKQRDYIARYKEKDKDKFTSIYNLLKKAQANKKKNQKFTSLFRYILILIKSKTLRKLFLIRVRLRYI